MRALGVGLAIVALGACSDRKTSTPEAPAAAIAPAVKTAKASPVIPDNTGQLITVVTDSWTSTTGTLHVWTRQLTKQPSRGKLSNGMWFQQGPAVPVVIGKAGAAWGIGLHGTGAPNREGPLKKEGDGKSPAGAFELRAAYGVADEPPKGSKLTYETTNAGDWECVDDPGSEHYAEIVERKVVPSDWQSSEQLLRDDALYTWIVDVAHNPERVRGKGSCIFLHVWGGKDSTTIGCTAMDEKALEAIVALLDPAQHPVFVLLPAEDYRDLAAAWDLPAVPTAVSPTP